MRIIVTGSNGFIGRHLIKRLIDEDYNVHAIIRPSTNKHFLDKTGIKYCLDDNNTNTIIDYINKNNIKGVVHLASYFTAGHKIDDVDTLINSNVLFSTRVLEASVTAGIKWFINTGTFWQHYEDKEYSPVNLYSATKQAFETIAQYYIETSDINFVTIKLNDTFGPDDTRPKIFNLWMNILKSGDSLDMSPGNQIMDISYIDDVIDAYVKLIDIIESKSCVNYRGKSFAVSSNQRMPIKELAKLFEKVTDTKLKINWGKRPYRLREVMLPWKTGETVPGWTQQVSLEEGILKTFKNLGQ